MERISKGRKQEQVGVVGTEGGRSPTGVPTTPTRPAGTGAANGPVPSPTGLPVPGSDVGGLPTAASVGATSAERPDPQVVERPVRRTFDRDYKLRILQEADACSEPGQIGSLLRREGLYSSHLAAWRRQRAEGTLAGLTPRRRGRKAQAVDPLAEENHRLRRENQRLATRLKQAETIIEVQKKVSEILGIPLNRPEMSANDD